MINVIVDTGFWFGYCTPKDEHHQKALDIFSYLLKIDSDLSFIIPYPSLYETLNTKFLRSGNKEGRDWFLEQLEFNPSFIKYDDTLRLRFLALMMFLEFPLEHQLILAL